LQIGDGDLHLIETHWLAAFQDGGDLCIALPDACRMLASQSGSGRVVDLHCSKNRSERLSICSALPCAWLGVGRCATRFASDQQNADDVQHDRESWGDLGSGRYLGEEEGRVLLLESVLCRLDRNVAEAGSCHVCRIALLCGLTSR
jgi:hypothetical protein